MSGYIHYIFPLILGRTFDLSSMRVGVDIFDKRIFENITIYDYPNFSSRFGVIDGDIEKARLLQFFPPFLSYVRSGILDAGASGEYLSDIDFSPTLVDQVSRSHWTSSIHYVHNRGKTPEPIPNWTDYGKALGTHDVYEMVYGGECITSMRFRTLEKDKIQGTLSTDKVYKLGSQAQDEYMQDILKSINSTQIKIFSSIPLTNIPNDMESLYNITTVEYLSDLKRFNNGKGLPLMFRLRSLTRHDSSGNISAYIKDKRIVERKLIDTVWFRFDDAFYDLSIAKQSISLWMKTIKKPLTEQQEQKIADLYNIVENLFKFFYEVLDTLGTPQGPEQLQKAKEKYYAEERKIKTGQSMGFTLSFHRLRRNIEKELESSS